MAARAMFIVNEVNRLAENGLLYPEFFLQLRNNLAKCGLNLIGIIISVVDEVATVPIAWDSRIIEPLEAHFGRLAACVPEAFPHNFIQNLKRDQFHRSSMYHGLSSSKKGERGN
jgi:hypothetical protein